MNSWIKKCKINSCAGGKTYFWGIPKNWIRFVERNAFSDESNFKKHSYLFWNFAASGLCLVFPEYSCVHIGIGCFIYYGPPSSGSVLQNPDKEMVFSPFAKCPPYSDNNLGNYHYVFCYFRPSGDHADKLFLEHRQRKNCSAC